MTSIYVVRHGLSEANNHANFGTPLFGHPEAPLMELGREQSRAAGQLLLSRYNIDPHTTRAATSRMRRTHETAIEAGCDPDNLIAYPLLDEVTNRLSMEQITHAIETQTPPHAAIQQVEELLADPPEEEIWFTHGFVIATICYVKNVPYPNFIPKHGTIRRVNI